MVVAHMFMEARQYREDWQVSDIKQGLIDNGVSGAMLEYRFAMLDHVYGVPVGKTEAEKDEAVREYVKLTYDICMVAEAYETLEANK